MAEDKTSVKEAISAIRGMSATFRSFVSAEAALVGLMNLDATRESIEERTKISQRELDDVLKNRSIVDDEIAKEALRLESFREGRIKEIEANVAKYLEDSEIRFNKREDELAVELSKLEDKKSMLEFDVSNLSDVAAKRDAILAEIADLNGKCAAEQARLDGIKFEIAAFKNRL
jgi:hypothetical protein